MIIALYAPKGSRDAKFLANYALHQHRDPLTRVRGIGSIVVQGAGAYAMREWVKPDQLASLGVTVPDLVSALEPTGIRLTLGQVGAGTCAERTEFTIHNACQGAWVTDQDFGNTWVRRTSNGSLSG